MRVFCEVKKCIYNKIGGECIADKLYIVDYNEQDSNNPRGVRDKTRAYCATFRAIKEDIKRYIGTDNLTNEKSG